MLSTYFVFFCLLRSLSCVKRLEAWSICRRNLGTIQNNIRRNCISRFLAFCFISRADVHCGAHTPGCFEIWILIIYCVLYRVVPELMLDRYLGRPCFLHMYLKVSSVYIFRPRGYMRTILRNLVHCVRQNTSVHNMEHMQCTRKCCISTTICSYGVKWPYSYS